MCPISFWIQWQTELSTGCVYAVFSYLHWTQAPIKRCHVSPDRWLHFRSRQRQVLYAAAGCCQVAATQNRRSCVPSEVHFYVIKNRAGAQHLGIRSAASPHSKTAFLANLKTLVQRSHRKGNHFNLWDRKAFCSWADNSCSLVLIGWSFVIMMAKPVKQMLQIPPFRFMNVETSLSACYIGMQSFTAFVPQTERCPGRLFGGIFPFAFCIVKTEYFTDRWQICEG